MRGWIESIQVWGRTVYKGKLAVYKENSQNMGGDRQYMRRGQTVNKGVRTLYKGRRTDSI